MQLVIKDGVLVQCRFYGEVITRLEVPEGVTQVGADSFMFGGLCSNMGELETVVLPQSVTKIGAGAFRNCRKLKKINLPEDITVIGSGAFHGCASLKEIRLPDGLLEIGDMAFSGCASIEEVTVPDSVRTIGSGGGYVAGAFSSCQKLKSVKLGRHITSIPKYMFLGCSQLTAVKSAKPLVAVGQEAFGGCTMLGNLFLAENVQIGEGAFYGCNAMADEQGMLILQDTLYGYCGESEDVMIPGNVKNIGRKAFYENNRVTSVIIPEGVKTIESEAFRNCGKLEKIRIPEGVQQLGSSAFSACTSLSELSLPESLKTIPQGMAYECTALKRVRMSQKLLAVEGGAFYGCSRLSYLLIPETIRKMDSVISKSAIFVPKLTFDSYRAATQSRYWANGSALYTMALPQIPAFRILLNDKIGNFVFDKKNNFSMTAYDSVLEANDAKLSASLQALAMLYRLKFPAELTAVRKTAFTAVVCKQVKKIAPYISAVPEDDLITLLENIGAVTQKTKKSILVLAGLEEAPTEKKKKTPAKDGSKTLSQLKKEWSFTKLENGTIRLDGYKGDDIHVEIPASIGADPVSEIAAMCFYAGWSSRIRHELRQKRNKIISIAIPEGITTIEYATFCECNSLETVKLPQSLCTIKQEAFLGCKNLKNLNLAQNVELETMALKGCWGLADEAGFLIRNGKLFGYSGDAEEVTVPDGVQVICRSSFYKLKRLQRVILSDSVTTVENHAWDTCDQIQSVTFPADICTIERDALSWCGYSAMIRGYTGTAAEEFAKQHRRIFESLGVVESRKRVNADFEIAENGVLMRYTGKDSEVIIPEGVSSVGGFWTYNQKGIFEDNTSIRKIVIPEGVKRIAPDAFRGSALEEIVIPDTVAEVSKFAFEGTPWLENQKQEQVYAGKVLIDYREPEGNSDGELREIAVSEGTVAIGSFAFGETQSMLRVLLPRGLKSLNTSAFDQCKNLKELMIPAGLETMGFSVFRGVLKLERCWGGVLHSKMRLKDSFMVFYTGEPDDSAWLLFYQTDKWKKKVYEKMNESPERVDLVLKEMIKHIAAMAKPEAALGNKAATFAIDFCKSAGKDNLQCLLTLLREKQLPAAKKLEKDTSFMEVLKKQDEDFSKLHPVEAEIFRDYRPTPVFENVLSHIPEGICYAGETTVCAPRVIAYIISEYIKQSDYVKMPKADDVAGKLDQTQLLKLLAELADRYAGEYSVPYARYADDKNVASLLSMMREWDDWYSHGNAGRQNIIIARAGLLLNDTKTAAMYFEKIGLLEYYAAIRNMSAQVYRDTVLAEFGFDANREIRYDLGGNVLVVKLEKDLQLSLLDTNAGKIVKSVPKKNADAALYENTKKEIAAMRKNIKKVLTARRDLLFRQFLTGQGVPAADWKQVYQKNPVLGSIGQLLVWLQEGNTFLLTDAGTVKADGSEYFLSEAEIALAHPMEMRKTELEDWQRYFTKHGIRQPFEQIWEGVADMDNLKEDRYAGYLIPYYRFFGQEKHGIFVEDEDYHNEITISFEDCSADVERIDQLRHVIEMENRFDVQSISVAKRSRAANHVLVYLDKVTIYERIKKDDITVATSLSSFTMAQITEFIQLAVQENATNVTAVLLEYQNQNFADLDPMEQFSLEL